MAVETSRLRLRPPRLTDAPAMMTFFGDAEAQRYTLHFDSIRACRHHIAAHERHRRRVGCGPWLVSDKATGETVGWGGLYEDPFDRRWGIEVAYTLARQAWGKGYASELVAHCLEQARDALGLAEVIAFSHADNIGSRRVLEKAGFAVDRFVPEMDRYLYRRRLS